MIKIKTFSRTRMNKESPIHRTKSNNKKNEFAASQAEGQEILFEKYENGILYVSGVDALNGTPVLDIKPYLPSIDGVKSTQNELIEKELGLNSTIP